MMLEYELKLKDFMRFNKIGNGAVVCSRELQNSIAVILNYKHNTSVFTAALVKRVAYRNSGGTNEQARSL